MKAMVLTAYKRLEIQDVPRPEPGPRDVLVRVRACGICGSDVHGYDGSTGRRIPPIVMGHEAAGVVEAVGPEVRGFRPGDRVTFDSTVHCGECDFCRAGQINLCDHRQVLGVSPGEYRRHGAFAESVAVPERIVCGVPDAVPLEHAAMVEPLSVAVHAVRRRPDRRGRQGARGRLRDDRPAHDPGGEGGRLRQRWSPSTSTTAGSRRPRGSAPTSRSARRDDVAARIAELTGGRGVDVAFEAVGAAAPIATAVRALRKGGTLTLIGNVTPKVELDLQAIVTRELSVLGSCASCGEYPESLELLASGAVRLDGLISARWRRSRRAPPGSSGSTPASRA